MATSTTLSFVKNKINGGLFAALVIGLLLGYIVYPFINPSTKKIPQSQEQVQDDKTPRAGWTRFEDKKYGIAFDYPASWTRSLESQVFEHGDIVAVDVLGETQEVQTEFYD